MGKAADQALARRLAEIRATKAQLQSDVQALTGSTSDTMGTVMGLVGASGSSGGGTGSSRGAGAGKAARDAAPKALAALGAMGATAVAAGQAKKKKAVKRAQDAERMSARIRSEELARAFGSITPAGAIATVADEPVQAAPGPIDEPESTPPADAADAADEGGGRRGLGMVLLVAAVAGAAVWFKGRR